MAHRSGWRLRANPARRQIVGRCHHQLRAVFRRRIRTAARRVLLGYFRHRSLQEASQLVAYGLHRAYGHFRYGNARRFACYHAAHVWRHDHSV